MAARLVLSLLLVATPAAARAPLSLEGVWVSAETRRWVQSGQTGDPGCFLEVSEGPQVEENCAEGIYRWPRVSQTTTAASVELVWEGVDGPRRAVVRAGTPSEMELRIDRDGELEYRRFYRLDARHLRGLRNLALARDRLVGEWTTEDGVSLSFRPDGTYAFGGDVGRYRVAGGFTTAGGAFGALFLEPEQGGPVRRYLLHGEGARLGLAEVPRDMDLLLLPEAEEDEAEEVEPAEEGGAGAVVLDGVEIPLPSEEEGPTSVLPPGAEEPAPRIWFDRRSETATAERAPEDEISEEESAPEEPPPIARPIKPARKCGCQAAEAGAGLGLLVPWLVWRARRRS